MSDYHKNHDDWNNVKKILNWMEIPLIFEECEIWWIAYGVNIGNEIDGKGTEYGRPALIIKKFNDYSFFAVPLSVIKNFKPNIHVPILHPSLKSDTCAVLIQARSFGNERLLERIGVLDCRQFELIVNRILNTLDPRK